MIKTFFEYCANELEKIGIDPLLVFLLICLILFYSEIRNVNLYRKFTLMEKFYFYIITTSSFLGIIIFVLLILTRKN